MRDERLDEILNPPEDRDVVNYSESIPRDLQEEQLKLAQDITLAVIRDCPSYMVDFITSAFSAARESLTR